MHWAVMVGQTYAETERSSHGDYVQCTRVFPE